MLFLFALNMAVLATAQNPCLDMWPIPKTCAPAFSCTGISLSPTFEFVVQSSYPILNDAITRYSALLSRMGIANGNKGMASNLTFSITDSSSLLTPTTNFSYTLSLNKTAFIATAETVYGALYALESFSQLLYSDEQGLSLSCAVTVTDYPDYSYRGLLLDVGRRFMPLPLLQTILDGMFYSKMNVLRLHLSDYGAVRYAGNLSNVFTGLDGSYTSADITALVTYAQARGIRVIPEYDLTSHADGYSALAGVSYCDATWLANASASALMFFILATSAAFNDKYYSIGGPDPMSPVSPDCLSTVSALQATLNTYLLENKKFSAGIPVGNNTLNLAYAPFPNINQYTEWVGVDSNTSSFLLLSTPDGAIQDPLPNGTLPLYQNYTALAGSSSAAFLGASASFWTNQYCSSFECGFSTGATPNAAWMAPTQVEPYFDNSVEASLFPRVTALAGALWNYAGALNNATERIEAHRARLQFRGIRTCAAGCDCSESYSCAGVKWSVLPKATALQAGVIMCITIASTVLLSVVAAVYSHGVKSQSGYASLSAN